MTFPIDLMVQMAECQALADERPEVVGYLPQLDKLINERLKSYGIVNVQAARSELKLAVARIVAARKIADNQFIQLAARDRAEVMMR